jgi:hypothetical protein
VTRQAQVRAKHVSRGPRCFSAAPGDQPTPYDDAPTVCEHPPSDAELNDCATYYAAEYVYGVQHVLRRRVGRHPRRRAAPARPWDSEHAPAGGDRVVERMDVGHHRARQLPPPKKLKPEVRETARNRIDRTHRGRPHQRHPPAGYGQATGDKRRGHLRRLGAPQTRASTKAGPDPKPTQAPLLATSDSYRVVGGEALSRHQPSALFSRGCRHAQSDAAGPIRGSATFGSRSRPVTPLRPALRGTRDRRGPGASQEIASAARRRVALAAHCKTLLTLRPTLLVERQQGAGVRDRCWHQAQGQRRRKTLR